MRKVKRYQKKQGSKLQKKKLDVLNKFQDDIAKCFYDPKYKNKN